MSACGFDVTQGTSALEFDFILTKRADHAGRHPHCEHSGRDRRAGRHDRTGGNERILADLCSIEDDRSDPDERAISHAAAMYDRAMPDRDLVSQQRREAALGDMQRRLVLDIRALANSNSLYIASQHRSEKDARVGADLDVPDDGGSGRDPDAGMQARVGIPKATNDRARPKIQHPIQAARLRNQSRRYRRSAGSRRESSGYNAHRNHRSP